MKYTKAPAITGNQLIWLLKKDGWIERPKRTKDGIALTKKINDRKLVTFVPDKNEPLPPTTLGQILGVKQTRIGKKGLLELLNKYGLP